MAVKGLAKIFRMRTRVVVQFGNVLKGRSFSCASKTAKPGMGFSPCGMFFVKLNHYPNVGSSQEFAAG